MDSTLLGDFHMVMQTVRDLHTPEKPKETSLDYDKFQKKIHHMMQHHKKTGSEYALFQRYTKMMQTAKEMREHGIPFMDSLEEEICQDIDKSHK